MSGIGPQNFPWLSEFAAGKTVQITRTLASPGRPPCSSLLEAPFPPAAACTPTPAPERVGGHCPGGMAMGLPGWSARAGREPARSQRSSPAPESAPPARAVPSSPGWASRVAGGQLLNLVPYGIFHVEESWPLEAREAGGSAPEPGGGGGDGAEVRTREAPGRKAARGGSREWRGPLAHPEG